jgi:hypothetical protein
MNYLKLTYSGRNSPTLVNMNEVRTMYTVSDPNGKYEPSTKVQFKDGDFINVSEDLQTILKLTQEFHAGNYQETNWETIPTVQKRIETSFIHRKVNRERNFNSQDAYNENRW